MTLHPAFLPLLVLTALPFGLWLARGLLPAGSRVARLGTATLAGAGALTAVAHALLCVGVPARLGAPLVGAGGLVLGLALLARARRQPAPETAPARGAAAALLLEAGPLALVALLLLVPFGDAREFGITENDTVRIWAPKAVRALTEAPPRLEGGDHAHPEYPRGIGILTGAVSMAAGEVDPRLPRFVGLFLFAMTLLCAFDALSSRGNPWGGLAAMVILGSLPVPVRHSISGLMDGTLGGFVLVASTGLAPQRKGAPCLPIVLAGAWGALVTKDEGLPYFAAVMLVLAWRLVRAREIPRLAGALALSALVALPWVVLRLQVHGEPFLGRSSPQNAGLLLMRFDLMIRKLGNLALGLGDPFPGGYTLPDVVPGGDRMVLAAIACGIVLLVGRRGSFPVLPAGLLLITDFVVIAFSTVGIDWQLVTAYNRLTLQVFPLLLVAAIDKLTSPEATAPATAQARAEAPAAAAA